MARFLCALLALAPVTSGSAVELTATNFEEQVFGGKNAFVKFLAPW